jgi:hypothetical protein
MARIIHIPEFEFKKTWFGGSKVYIRVGQNGDDNTRLDITNLERLCNAYRGSGHRWPIVIDKLLTRSIEFNSVSDPYLTIQGRRVDEKDVNMWVLDQMHRDFD